jgi:hypothetical protein
LAAKTFWASNRHLLGEVLDKGKSGVTSSLSKAEELTSPSQEMKIADDFEAKTADADSLYRRTRAEGGCEFSFFSLQFGMFGAKGRKSPQVSAASPLGRLKWNSAGKGSALEQRRGRVTLGHGSAVAA